VSTGGKAA